uniref:von Willebrand factor A domain containing 5B2 n=1 Tax=Amazona collaria TaxID=241587 RepID=A0A8B9FEG4_9PSIT
MPGLYVLSSWEPLPLKSSRVKACANGYSLSITAHLTYTNPHEEPVEGIFIYPLEQSEVVASFEAAAGSRRVTFQVQNRHRAQDCCLQCIPNPSQPRHCAGGHLVLDEDVERSTFIIVTGMLCASESLSITLSTAQELGTLPDGALRLLLPPILTPRVPADPESEPASLCDDSPTSCFGGPGARSQPPPMVPAESVDVFRGRTCNPFPYEFAFELLVKGPCLLAGLESPSHALRADADPWASSATTTCVTLAEPHRYDRDLEIILYPCEPHHPHLVMEDGTMTYPEYETLVRSRRDFMRIARKDSSGERQVAFVQKRFHKDIFPNPVLMLNFCPAAEGVPGNLQSITREVLFLIDCSSTMSSPDLDKVKSLPSGTLLNVASFGADVKPLFPSSRLCSNVSAETLRRACEHLGRLWADAGSTNLLAALRWALAQPLHHGYPRQLFLFTNTAAGNTGRILRLVRRQASTVRCFSFGMGPRVCQRLLKGMAKVSRGRAEFLSPAERLQPKLIKSLKKALEPAISDITIDWYVPDSMEALLSPTEFPALYPGDRLVSYCVLYSIARFRSRCPQGREGPHRGSAFPSQEEVPSPGESCQQLGQGSGLGAGADGVCACRAGVDPASGGDIWKRIYQPSYIQEQYVLTHCSVSTDRSRGLLSHSSTSSESTGSRDVAPEAPGTDLRPAAGWGCRCPITAWRSLGSAPVPLLGWPSALPPPQVMMALSMGELARRKKALARAALASRSFSSPHGELDAHRLYRALEKVSQKRNQSLEGQLDELGPQGRQLQPTHVLLFTDNLLSPTHLDWDMLVEPSYLFSASPMPEPGEPSLGNASLPLRCQVVIHALSAGKPVSWEVTASLESVMQPRLEGPGRKDPPQRAGKVWDKPLHRLAARSVIRDNENAAQREAELEQGFARRFRLKAVQTSKACNVPSLYTRLVPVDGATQAALPAAPEVWGTGTARGPGMLGTGWQRGTGLRWHRPLQPVLPGSHNPFPAAGWNCVSPLSTHLYPCRFSLSRHRGPSLALRLQCLSPERERSSNHDYLPLVQLQQARGPFQLTESFSDVVQIPLDRLRRASPYASHRASLSPPSSPPSQTAPSEAGMSWQDVGQEDLDSASWATAVALAWLEHRCAGFFEEWELVAAKADAWLQAQRLPEGVDVACLKGAARHLFLLLRHWDENIKLNMLCYNPNNV